MKKILIVGGSGGTHIGDAFFLAAKTLGLDAVHLDQAAAGQGSWISKKISWFLLNHRPVRLSSFGRMVSQSNNSFKPDWLVATGLAPLQKKWLLEIKKMGASLIIYLTDDPWNKSQRANWFFEALPLYDIVFTPRKTNMTDLQRAGCRDVRYLPFGYSESLFYREPRFEEQEKTDVDSDILFAGGADRDRIPYMEALINAGIDLRLYGDCWDHWKKTRAYFYGYASPEMLRKAIGRAKICLCLVRRMNRDGHSMRTFEIPAVGSCMLVEDTREHHEIFGPEGKCVMFFGSVSEMIQKAKFLLENTSERQRLSMAAHQLITGSKNTYKDRLMTMLNPDHSW